MRDGRLEEISNVGSMGASHVNVGNYANTRCHVTSCRGEQDQPFDRSLRSTPGVRSHAPWNDSELFGHPHDFALKRRGSRFYDTNTRGEWPSFVPVLGAFSGRTKPKPSSRSVRSSRVCRLPRTAPSRCTTTARETATLVFIPEAGLGGWSWAGNTPVSPAPTRRSSGISGAPVAPTPRAAPTPRGPRRRPRGGACRMRRPKRPPRRLRPRRCDCPAGRLTSSRVATLSLYRGRRVRVRPRTVVRTAGRPRGASRVAVDGLSADFRDSHPDVCEGIVDWRVDGDADRAGWEAQVAALEGSTRPTR